MDLFFKSFFVISPRLFAFVINFAQISYISHLLSPDKFGQYFYLITVANYLAIVVAFGLNQYFLVGFNEDKLNASRKSDSNFYAFETICFYVLNSLIVSSIAALVFFALHVFFEVSILSGGFEYFYFFSIFLMQALQYILVEIFRVHTLIGRSIFFGGPLSILFSIIILWMLKSNGPNVILDGVICVMALSLFLQNLVGVYFLRSYINIRLNLDDFFEKWGRSLRFGFSVTLNSLLQFSLGFGVIAILGLTMSNQDIGIFGIAQRMAGVVMVLSSLLYAVYPNKIIYLSSKRKFKHLQIILSMASFVGLIFGSVVFLIYFNFGSEILRLLYGAPFEVSYFPMLICFLGSFFNLATGIRGAVLLLTRYNALQLYITAFSCLIMFVGMYYFSLYLGVIGASVAFAASVIIQCFLEMVYVNKIFHISTVGLFFCRKKFDIFFRIWVRSTV